MGTAAQDKTVQGAALGTALGAGAGAIIGNQTHRAGEGAAIGAGLGAIGGALVGHGMQERSMTTTTTPTGHLTKFCPVGGEFYDDSVKYCPIHGVELRERQA